MKFVVDAQLPPAWAQILNEKGHDATHTRDLAKGNLTPDSEILKLAIAEDRVVLSKDTDFLHSFLTLHIPKKLIFVRLGNLRIRETKDYLRQNLETILISLEEGSLIELWQDEIKTIY